MTKSDDSDGWTAHATEQRRAWLTLSYAERLQWLEDAKRFVAVAHGAARRKRRPATREQET